MRDEFSWYFKPSEAVIKSAWDSGLLTVDANVLLDLYRYHDNTRNSLLACMERFRGRLWISRQAAEEFFRNRKKVIIAASGGFRQAIDELGKLTKAVAPVASQLEQNRLIAGDIPNNLRSAISDAIGSAEKRISEAATAYPKYLDSDPLLDRILTMFSKSVGPDFSDEDRKRLKAEAEQRKKAKIPPGYLDEDKDGDRPYGDFFLWRQVLDQAKGTKTPIIFVTSERKDDWWEKHSGASVGPRLELIREAAEYAGQLILIYQTDHFLKVATERAGGTVDDSAVKEIRAIDTIRASAGVVLAVNQTIKSASTTMSVGNLTVEIGRSTFSFTASGHFVPNLDRPPELAVRLVESPQPLPSYRLNAGTGTVHDFNVHLKSADFGIPLPAGRYVFEYGAKSLSPVEA